jgi:hypothetical protein
MKAPTVRSAYSTWPKYNGRIRDVVGAMTDEQLAIRLSPERWPLWATVGHMACQRVFWLCDFAGEPGAETTPFTNAGESCPDEDLDHVLSSGALVEALDSTFRIIDGCLDRWTADMLTDEIRRKWGNGNEWVRSRGFVIQRVFSHDVYHCAELNGALGIAGLPLIDLWG